MPSSPWVFRHRSLSRSTTEPREFPTALRLASNPLPCTSLSLPRAHPSQLSTNSSRVARVLVMDTLAKRKRSVRRTRRNSLRNFFPDST